jgi:hypothetical protein
MDNTTQDLFNRSHLEELIDRYFEALISHDSSKLPLASKVKNTENTVLLKPGEGLWGTASHPPSYKNIFVDTLEGQAGCFAALKENGLPALLSLRLREQDKLITEIETIIVRPKGPGLQPFESMVAPNPVFSETLAPAERSTRENLVAVAEQYFDGIQNHTAEYVQFDDECHRIENGMLTANNPNPGSIDNPISAMSGLKCIEQFRQNRFYFITKIHPRRYVLLDEERGLVLCNCIFVHAGKAIRENTPAFALRPSSVVISELFKIKKGKIFEIEVVGTMLPYGVKSGW